MENKSIAIIGCGRISGHHCRAIQATDGVEIAAACDLDESKAADYGHEFGVPHFTNYREMLKQLEHIDIVVIATPSGMHFEHAMEMITEFGKSVIVEKPTFMKPSQVSVAYAAAKEHGVEIFPLFQNRYNKAVQRVKQAVNDKQIGDVRILSVRVRWCRPQRYYDLSEWRGTFSMDGGAITNQGIHHIDLLRYLGGEVESVKAEMRTLGADIEVEDTVVATITFASGAVGTLEVTTAARPDDFEASISLVGEHGLAQIGGKAVNELEVFSPDESQCHAFSEDFTGSVYGNGHQFLYQSISDHFHLNKPYLISEQDCFNSIKLLHAFYVSNETRQEVNFDNDFESARLGEDNEPLANLYRLPV